MPRFLSIAYADERNRPTGPPSPELQQKMVELFDEITKAGVVLDMAELTPTDQATRISLDGDKVAYTDGPFAETKEVIGGYTLIQAKDKAEALEWAKRFVEVQGQYDNTSVEVREIIDN